MTNLTFINGPELSVDDSSQLSVIWIMLDNAETTEVHQVDKRIGISQFHNTVPFYNGNFQYLENNLDKLENLNEVYDDYYYDEIENKSYNQSKNKYGAKIGNNWI